MLEISRQGSVRFDIYAFAGMRKPKDLGMKALPFQAEGGFPPSSIDFIPQQGMPNMRQMNPYLVRTPRFQSAFHIGEAGKPLQNFIMGDRRFSSSFVDGHLFPVFGMPANGSANRSFILFQNPIANGMIFTHNGMLFQLGSNAVMGKIIFTDNNGTRSILINAVNNPWP